jgi:hypothetical protein
MSLDGSSSQNVHKRFLDDGRANLLFVVTAPAFKEARKATHSTPNKVGGSRHLEGAGPHKIVRSAPKSVRPPRISIMLVMISISAGKLSSQRRGRDSSRPQSLARDLLQLICSKRRECLDETCVASEEVLIGWVRQNIRRKATPPLLALTVGSTEKSLPAICFDPVDHKQVVENNSKDTHHTLGRDPWHHSSDTHRAQPDSENANCGCKGET